MYASSVAIFGDGLRALELFYGHAELNFRLVYIYLTYDQCFKVPDGFS